MSEDGGSSIPLPSFPTHDAPRVWLITAGDSAVGISIARKALEHGDSVVSGIVRTEFENYSARREGFKAFLAEVGGKVDEGWKERLRIINLNVRIIAQCQSAIATAVQAFGKLDILLCCTSQAIIGTVEELAASQNTQALIRDQFETNFFGPMNAIKAALNPMRAAHTGHIIVLGGIAGHLGTPGLGVYCASNWALEGFCDSIAYEIAPFNVKVTIVQASIEIGILTNKVTSVPPQPAYAPDANNAPLFRGILDGLLNRLPGIRGQYHQPPKNDTEGEPTSPLSSEEKSAASTGPDLLSRDEVTTLYPPLSLAHTSKLIAETVHCILAIGGHENPPARHIVGLEGVASVKEKLKTVSEELEDFVEISAAVDVDQTARGPGRQGETGRKEEGPVDFGFL